MVKHRGVRYITTNYFRHIFCMLFSFGSFFIISLLVFIKHKSVDSYAIMDILHHSVPEVFILGAIGWFIGIIIDNPKKALMTDYKDLIYEELIKNNKKISLEELTNKLNLTPKIQDDENQEFPLEDVNMNIGESDVEL